MFKAVFIGDTHFTFQAPLMRREDYGERILEKIEWCLQFANRESATVFHTGDLFHRKGNTTFREANAIASLVLKYKQKLYMIVGSDDMFSGYVRNFDRQAIGMLEKCGVVEFIQNGKDFGDGVYVDGMDFCRNYEEQNPYSAMYKDCDFHARVTHGMLTDSDLPYNCTNIGECEVNADLLVNGHHHRFWICEEKNTYNIGSISRNIMNENEINKQPKMLYVKYNGRLDVDIVDVPCEKDVWVNEIKREQIDNEDLDKFVESIKDMDLSDESAVLDEVLKDYDEDVKKKVLFYLER